MNLPQDEWCWLDRIREEGLRPEYLQELGIKAVNALENTFETQPLLLFLRRLTEVLSSPLRDLVWVKQTIFYLILLETSPLLYWVASTIKQPERKKFFFEQWFPYACFMKTWLRTDFFHIPSVAFTTFANALTTTWAQQIIDSPIPMGELERHLPLNLVSPLPLTIPKEPVTMFPLEARRRELGYDRKKEPIERPPK